MEYYVYILYSEKLNKYYIGYTKGVAERLIKHNQNRKGFTSRAKDWVVVYQEEYKTKTEAYAREREIKSWKSRKKIVALIENN